MFRTRRPEPRTGLPAISLALALFAAPAAALEVTGSFTGWWGQPDQENHGVIVSVSELPTGEKTAVIYWANYDDEGNPDWMFAQGGIQGDRIQAELYRFEGVTFMQPDDPSTNPGQRIGTMQVQFDSCTDGDVAFDFESPNVIVGTGGFRIARLTNQPGTLCSGGVADNTPPDALPEAFRVQLVATGATPGASGKADFESRPGRAEFTVEAEDLPAGAYELRVDGEIRGVIDVADTINGPEGEIEFRSPAEPGKELLDFDPRGALIEVLDGSTVVLESVAPDSGEIPGSGQGTPPPFGDSEIEVDLVNQGVYPDGSGEAELEQDERRVAFDVEIEDVPAGSYSLTVGGTTRGTIAVIDTVNGPEGEIEFRYPAEPGKSVLDFDPRGQSIEILENGSTLFSVSFPASDDDGDDGEDDDGEDDDGEDDDDGEEDDGDDG